MAVSLAITKVTNKQTDQQGSRKNFTVTASGEILEQKIPGFHGGGFLMFPCPLGGPMNSTFVLSVVKHSPGNVSKR
jgi:hypothetical protein